MTFATAPAANAGRRGFHESGAGPMGKKPPRERIDSRRYSGGVRWRGWVRKTDPPGSWWAVAGTGSWEPTDCECVELLYQFYPEPPDGEADLFERVALPGGERPGDQRE